MVVQDHIFRYSPRIFHFSLYPLKALQKVTNQSQCIGVVLIDRQHVYYIFVQYCLKSVLF